MYPEKQQMEIDDFIFPYGELDPQNDWVRMASIIPWDEVEKRYKRHFVNNGHPAHSARRALGALLIKQRLGCSDEWTVKHVSENPYLQFFLGEKEYTNGCPFGASTMVEFRKRLSEEDIAAIMEMTVPKPGKNKDDDEDHGKGSGDGGSNQPHEDVETSTNDGVLLLDATCCPANIAFPQDINLLNDAREKTEKIIDELCEDNHLPKPRMYRKQARKDYLQLSKSKKRTCKQTRKAIRKQLQYIRRDVGFIVTMIHENGIKLNQKQCDQLNVITTVYEQQRRMYDEKSHSVPDRIVSLSQPWIRPIVRGKAKAKTEFGAKLHISMVNGYANIIRIDFDAFNEADDFYKALAQYHRFYGCYPKRVLADKIYRNRQTIAFCKEHGIQMSGPPLGRPPKDQTITREARKQEYVDICDRNAVEGGFGTGKGSYGLGCIAARLEATSRTVIAVGLLCMNLCKRLRSLVRFFLDWILGWLERECFSLQSVG